MKQKNAMWAFFVIYFVLILATVHAESNWFDSDGIFHIPQCEQAPVIDGEMDMDVYANAFSAPDTAAFHGNREPVFDWWDFWVTHRMVWKGEMLYVFVCVHDDILYADPELATWQHDNIELYFDGDNSDGEGQYDGFDDIQLRWTYDETETEDGIDVGYGQAEDWGFDPTMMEWAMTFTDLGYNLEVGIPYPELSIVEGAEFGFETQIGDTDGPGEGDQVFYRWNWPGDGSWMQTLNHGTAVLVSDRVVSDILDVQRIESPPTIDGEFDEVWWTIPEISQNTYVTIPEDAFNYPLDWWDLLMDFRAAWDDDNFYLFVDVVDDFLETELGEVWLKDGVELYFDGLNEDSGEYDDNDQQSRWVLFDETVASNYPNSVHAFGETDIGWTFELMIPFDDLQDIDPAVGHEFGFELQINDNDGDPDLLRETMARWWSPDNDSWQNSELFGTAMLVGEEMDVKDRPVITLPTRMNLLQNYPNPFNPTTNITYSVVKMGHVRLSVYDMLGKKVADLVDETKSPGSYTVTFDGSELTSGVYVYKLETDSEIMADKMMLIK